MRRLPRSFRRVLGGLVAFELVYVATGLFLVKSGRVDRWLNAHPEKRVIRFESVWTVIPGVAHVRGFHMVNQGRNDQLELIVDGAIGFVNPLELPARRIHIIGLRARGVEFRYRKRPKTPEEAVAKAAVVPPIEGLPFESYAGPPQEKKTKPGWTLVFTGTTVLEIRDVWLEALRLKGPAELSASVTVGAGQDKRLSIRGADIRFDGGAFLSAGETTLQDLDLHVRGRMEPFFTKQTRGRALLGLISARIDLSARSPGATLMNRYFAKADWLVFDSEDRSVTARLDLDRGQLGVGSHLELAEAPLGVTLAGFVAEGQATARLEAVPSDEPGRTDLQVTVEYTDYGMRRQAEGLMVMRGDGLRIEARSPDDIVDFPPRDFEGRLALGKAEFPDLTFVNEYLPGGAGLAVKAGRASVDGRFEIGHGAACQGQMTVTTADVVVDAGGVESSGDVTVSVEVPRGNFAELRFGLDRTRVDLASFAFTSAGSADDAPSWQGQITVTEGTVDLGEAAGTDIRLDVAFSDTRPLVAFLSRDKPLRGWQERMLAVERLSGEGVARLERGATTIRHFGLRGEKVDIRFRALVDARGAFGKARVRYGFLKAGIGLAGPDRHLKVTRVGHWYQQDDIPGMPPLLREFEEIGAK